MSQFVQKYLAKTRESNNANQLNFSGNGRYSNFVGNQFTGASIPRLNATGPAAPAAAMPQATPSHPYLIVVSNSAASSVANFPLFNANTLLFGGKFTAGNYVDQGITVSSGIGGVLYQTLVAQSITQPFTIGQTAITATTNNAQILQAINVTTTDASGLTQGVPIIFIKDPYQNQTDMIVNSTSYRIDGTTVMTIANVLPSAVFTLYLYPAQNINPASQLMGASTTQSFANPNLIRVLPSSTGVM